MAFVTPQGCPLAGLPKLVRDASLDLIKIQASITSDFECMYLVEVYVQILERFQYSNLNQASQSIRLNLSIFKKGKPRNQVLFTFELLILDWSLAQNSFPGFRMDVMYGKFDKSLED